MIMKCYLLILYFLFAASAISSGCSAISGGKSEYNTIVSFSKSQKIQFPDFTLEFTGERNEKKEFPNGNSFNFRFYDFKISSPSDTKAVSWSGGTGDIAPSQFEFGGRKFELEMSYSEKLSKKLGDNELVIVNR